MILNWHAGILAIFLVGKYAQTQQFMHDQMHAKTSYLKQISKRSQNVREFPVRATQNETFSSTVPFLRVWKNLSFTPCQRDEAICE